MKLTEKVLSRYLNWFWSYMRLKSINWPQRSSLTSRVKGYFNIKLRTWSMNSIEKVLFRYLKRIWSYMRLKFTFWPQRSKLTSEVKGHNVNLLGYIRSRVRRIFSGALNWPLPRRFEYIFQQLRLYVVLKSSRKFEAKVPINQDLILFFWCFHWKLSLVFKVYDRPGHTQNTHIKET